MVDRCSLCDASKLGQQMVEEGLRHVTLQNRWAERGALIVSPKRHVQNLRGLSRPELYSLVEALRRASEVLHSWLSPKGIRFVLNEGQGAGQRIPHLHWHVFAMADGGKEARKPSRQKQRLSWTQLKSLTSKTAAEFASYARAG